MSSAETRADVIAARFEELGIDVRRRQVRDGCVYVEGEIATVTREAWTTFVTEVGALAEQFGAETTAAGCVVWACLHEETPATGDVRGHGHQLRGAESVFHDSPSKAEPARAPFESGAENASSYRSAPCRIGTHELCRHSAEERPGTSNGVRYESCDCPCHAARARTEAP